MIIMKLSNSEMSLMDIIWEKAPIKSGNLVKEALERLGWKKSTVYTIVKKLTVKGAVKSEATVITPICKREDVLNERSDELIEKGYNGSLPMFLAAFLQKEKLTREDAEELKRLIDSNIDERR